MAVFSLTAVQNPEGVADIVKPVKGLHARRRRRGVRPPDKLLYPEDVDKPKPVRAVHGFKPRVLHKAVRTLEQLVQVPSVALDEPVALDKTVAGFFTTTASTEMRAQGLLVVRAAARVNPGAVLHRGYLNHVFQWLQSRDKLLRPCAAAVLAALASQKMGREALFRNRDVLPRLVSMMKCGLDSLDAQYAALSVASWSLHQTCKDLIGRVGGIPVLVSLIKQAIIRPTQAQVVALRCTQEGGMPQPSESMSGTGQLVHLQAQPSLQSSGPASHIDTVTTTIMHATNKTVRISDSRLRLLSDHPAAVHAASALLNIVDNERNKRVMLAAQLPAVLQEAMCCPIPGTLLERCKLLMAMLGIAEIHHQAVQRVLGRHHKLVDDELPSMAVRTRQKLEAEQALDMIVELSPILSVQDDVRADLVAKAERRKKRRDRRAAREAAFEEQQQQQQQQTLEQVYHQPPGSKNISRISPHADGGGQVAWNPSVNSNTDTSPRHPARHPPVSHSHESQGGSHHAKDCHSLPATDGLLGGVHHCSQTQIDGSHHTYMESQEEGSHPYHLYAGEGLLPAIPHAAQAARRVSTRPKHSTKLVALPVI